MNGITLAQIIDATWLDYGAFGLLALVLLMFFVLSVKFIPQILEKWEKHIQVQQQLANSYTLLAGAIGDVDATVEAIKVALEHKAGESIDRHREVLENQKRHTEMLRTLLKQKQHRDQEAAQA